MNLHPFRLLFVCLMSLFFSCDHTNSDSNNEGQATKVTVKDLGNEPSKKENTKNPKKATNEKPLLQISIKGDDVSPQSIIKITANGVEEEITENAACQELKKADFVKNDIPAKAEAACFCWWAGYGVNYYVAQENGTATIYQKYTGEGDEDQTWEVYEKAEEDDFVPSGFAVLDVAEGDLNADGRKDMLLILAENNEYESSDVEHPAARPLLLLLRDEKGQLQKARQNNQTVLCVHCGGVMGDPYSKMVIKGNYFSIEHFGGSGHKWTQIVTYKYDEKAKEWYLHKFGGENIDPSGASEETVRTSKDFGKIKFEEVHIYKEALTEKGAKELVKVGMPLDKVQAANGKAFELLGFEIDGYLAGRVNDWKGGKLKGKQVRFEVTNDLPIEEYQQIMGDSAYPSDHPIMQKAGLIVIEVK